jgi:hypothetical protein
MTTNKLDKGLKELADKFKKDLIDFIKKKGHSLTGKLEKSISFSFKKNLDKYSLELTCNEYILYLDKGKFLEQFIKDKEKETEDKVLELITEDIYDNLNLN